MADPFISNVSFTLLLYIAKGWIGTILVEIVVELPNCLLPKCLFYAKAVFTISGHCLSDPHGGTLMFSLYVGLGLASTVY